MAHVVISLVHADEQQMVAVVRSRRAEIFAIAINFSLISQSNDLFLVLRSFYLKRQLEELIFQSNFPEIRFKLYKFMQRCKRAKKETGGIHLYTIDTQSY